MPRLPLLGALAMAFLLSAAGPARAGEVRLSKLSGVPASAALGDRFTPSGEVRLRGSGSPRVRLRAVLVGEDRSVAVGRKVLRKVRRDRPRRFRVPSVVPARGVPAGDYRVRVCARSRGREARCARTPMRVLVAYGAPTPTPAVTGTPEPTASATPTAGATATATVTATATATATPPVGTSTALPCPPMDAPRPVALPATLAARADGSESLGDPLFPNLGNGGYDVRSYDLALSYTPGLPLTAGTLAGTATIVAEATAPLDRFSLDLFGFTVSEVTVNGQPATASRVQDPGPYGAKKLRIAPTAQIPSGSTFTTVVTYSGQPPTVTDPDDSSEGFLPTSDGAFVVGEPMGSMGWFPNNNHPTDKATFKLAMTVPSTHTVVGNGDLVSSATNGLDRTWVWHEGNPMATYLATATLGIFNVTPTTDSKGLPYYDALDPAAGPASGVAIQKTAMDLFRGCFGDYPFSIYGSIVDFAPDVGYALETQTKPVYPSGLAANASTVSHELAHQWYGNSVSPATWRDIWLNEGFAEWGSWLYEESTAGGTTTAERFASLYAANPEGDSFWTVPPAAPPTGAELFNTDAMYDRGAMTLEALRQIHGNAVYYAVLRTWHSQFKYSTATTAQFIALVKQLSDKPDARLDAFFDDWLYDADRPAITPTNFDAP